MKTWHVVLPIVVVAVAQVLLAGHPPAPQAKTVWSGIYSSGQATRGQQAYTANCSRCHGAALQGTNGNGLQGSDFMERWREDSMGSLYEFVSGSMPPARRGAGRPLISVPTYLDIIAYILSQNQFPPGPNELAVDGLDDIRIQYQDGPRPLPNGALVWVAGCLAGSGDAWTLRDASEAIRTRNSETTNYEEFQSAEKAAPGAQSFHLANLGFLGNAFKPESHNGEKLLVKGTLVRQTDSMRIGVLAVRKVADACK